MALSALLLLKLALSSLAASLLLATATVAAPVPKPGCDRKCGNVDIPSPFGMNVGCFKDHDFQIICNSSSGNPIPYLARNKTFEILKISGNTSEIHVSMPAFHVCYDPKIDNYSLFTYDSARFWLPPKFSISSKKNNFNVLGSNTLGYLYDRKERRIHGCISNCGDKNSTEETDISSLGSCPVSAGEGFCQNDFEQALTNYSITVSVYFDSSDVPVELGCGYAFLAQNGSLNFSHLQDVKRIKESNRTRVVIDWAVDNKTSCGGACKGNNAECRESEGVNGYYYCTCKDGFQGNPYMDYGCQDVNECRNSTLNNCLHENLCHNTEGGYNCSCPHGQKGNGRNETGPGSGCSTPGHSMIIPLVVAITLLVVFTLVYILCWAHKQRTMKQLRQKNFEHNGGNLLLQQLSQQGYTNRTKIFTQVELKKATNNFDETRFLGRGGQGTVYKGILSDNTVVAIKKPRVGGDPQNIKSFINEVFVLSQINHRHVVKLLGCCLETEVPLLVYEFVDNGTLLDHLDPSKHESSITWETRLRIATETAEAISYLHPAASIPIIHRDIKSANILLDHNDRAKVSDFGASRLIHLDEAQVTTVVQGTIGYLDPEYLQTCQLNEKSDVYSFGIVLVELLTGNKAFEFNTLAKHFVTSLQEDRLWEILDKRMLDQKKKETQLKEVALLARRCIRVNGEERPTMKEVAMELEGIIAMGKHPQEKDKDMMVEESECLLGHCPNDRYGSASNSFSVASSYDSIQKHVTFEIIEGGR